MAIDKKSNLSVFINGAGVAFIFVVLMGIINYLIRRYLALHLTQIQFGFFYSAYAVVYMPVLFLDLGIGSTLTILLAKYRGTDQEYKTDSIFSSILIMKFIIGLVATIILLLLAKPLIIYYFKYPFGITALNIFIFYCLAASLSGIIVATLTGYKNFSAAYLFQFFFFFIIFLIIMFYPYSMVLTIPTTAYVVASSFVFITGYWYVVKKYNIRLLFNFKKLRCAWREVWNLTKWIALGIACLNALYYMDTIMLTIFTNLKEVGLYNIALPIMQIIQSLMIFPAVFLPIASSLWKEQKKDEIASLTNGFITLIIIIVWLVTIVMSILSKDVIGILFSYKFSKVYIALIILCIGMNFFILSQFYSGILNSIGEQKKASLFVLYSLIMNIFLNIIFIPLFSINGAAAATALSYLVLSILYFVELKRHIVKLSLNWLRTLYNSFIGLICLVVVYFYLPIMKTLEYRFLFACAVVFFFLLCISYTLITIYKNIKKQYKGQR